MLSLRIQIPQVQLRHVLRLARDLLAAQLQRGNLHGVPNRQVSIAGSDVRGGLGRHDREAVEAVVGEDLRWR